MTVNSIPLFRTPFLALRIILGRFGPCEIIQLSLCSKRSQRVAKQCWKKQGGIKATLHANMITNIDLQFHDDPLYRFVILEPKAIYNQKAQNIRVRDSVVPSIHKETETVTVWKDKLIGIQQISKYIKYLFDESVHSISLETEARPNDFIRIIDSIMSVQESIEKCTLHGDNSNDECLTHLLDNCKITGRLTICGGPSRQFSHNWNTQLDSLYLFNGSSITLPKLMNINCKFLELTSSSLTNEDANQFLKHWQNGGNSRLKFLSTEIKYINREVITSGIDTALQQQGLFRYYEEKYNFKMIRSGGVDLRRNDGTTGTIFFYDNAFQFGVDPTEDMQ